ncbi:unnamed protein product, partial [Symbiodinium sp. KB8]
MEEDAPDDVTERRTTPHSKMPSNWQRRKKSMPKLRHANSIQARTNVATMKALQRHAPSGTAGAATGMCHGQCGRRTARQGKHRGGLAFGPLVQSFHCLAIWPIREVPLSLAYLPSGTGLGPIVFLAADHINLIFIC